jgi:hypothetical protein
MMKVVIQRHGIVIKSVPVNGDRASIGSSPEANVVIDDPYLAAQVADIIKQADGWHLIDSGTSLEGITRGGERIDDELVVSGVPYSLGGFELVVQLEGEEASSQEMEIKRKTGERIVPGTVAENRPVVLPTMAENMSVPHTMMETELPKNEIPRTMFETPLPAAAQRQATPPRPAPQLAPQPQVAAARAVAPPKRNRRLLVLGTAFGLGLLLLLIVIVGGGKKEKPKPPVEVVKTPATTSTTPTAAVSPIASAAQSLAGLRYDEALTSWERQLASPTADAATRKRYADLALEVGRIHAANGSSDASKYFSNVVKYGAPDSPAVAEAKKRLGK